MHRIDSPNAEADKHGTGKDGWTEGDVATGTPPTETTEDIFDAFQEELATTVEDAGITLAKTDHGQLSEAIYFMHTAMAVANASNDTGTNSGSCKNAGAGLRFLIWDDNANQLKLSADNGLSWSNVTPGTTPPSDVVCIEHITDTTWVALGTDGTGTAVWETTDDGSTWTRYGLPVAAVDPNTIRYFDSAYYVGTGDGSSSSTGYIYRATTLSSWTAVLTLSEECILEIAFDGDSTFVAVGYDYNGGTTGPTLYSSGNGTSWTDRSSGITSTWVLSAAAYGAGVFVAAGMLPGSPDEGKFAYSTDGVSWTLGTTELDDAQAIVNITFDGRHTFVACGGDSSSGDIWLSSDGANWVQSFLDTSDSLNHAAFSSSRCLLGTYGNSSGIYLGLVAPLPR